MRRLNWSKRERHSMAQAVLPSPFRAGKFAGTHPRGLCQSPCLSIHFKAQPYITTAKMAKDPTQPPQMIIATVMTMENQK